LRKRHHIFQAAEGFWKLIGFLLLVIGCLLALWLISAGLRWIIEKIAAAFRKK
jgi:hypothetical protein